MNPILKRLVSHWYDPDEQKRRESRTDEAHQRAIQVRVYSEDVDRKVKQVGQKAGALRDSAERAGRRLSARDH